LLCRSQSRPRATDIKQEDVARALLDANIHEGVRAENIRSDNGSEFIAGTVQGFLADHGIKAINIEPGCPWRNGFIEIFNNYDDIQVAMDSRLLHYSPHRPPAALVC
jgi:transposase InsO family protein